LKKDYYKYFIYISFLFLIYALYKADYLSIPKISSEIAIYLSLIFLFAGFLLVGITWRSVLKVSGTKVTYSESVAGIGLSVFTKYIPGKLWTIIGRASYIAQLKNQSVKNLSVVSLNAQFISLWTALVIGIVGLLIIGKVNILGLATFILLGILTLLSFSEFFHHIGSKFLQRIFHKNITLPSLNLRKSLTILPWFILQQLIWASGFFFLIQGLYTGTVPFISGVGFPLAAAYGIVTVIAPGGLGVREGILITFLISIGLPNSDATTIAIFSRLWFLIGEIFIFIFGYFANKTVKVKALHSY